MRKTGYVICVGKKNGYDEYRTVMTDGKRYYVNYKKKLIDVTDDKNKFYKDRRY